MRRCGKGYRGVRRLLMLMNHPPPMSEKNYYKLTTRFSEAVRAVAFKSMTDASNEIHNLQTDGIVDTAVSVDGTWQKRGYSSMNGAVAAISMNTGRILDIAAFSRYCQGCISMERFQMSDPVKYANWKQARHCSINHVGSAPAMEVAGAKLIFNRSIEKHNLRYTEFYGDGDSKSFNSVKDVYDGITIKKQECIGHIQKRVGNRLRKLKRSVKGLGGTGKLTDTIIDRLQRTTSW